MISGMPSTRLLIAADISGSIGFAGAPMNTSEPADTRIGCITPASHMCVHPDPARLRHMSSGSQSDGHREALLHLEHRPLAERSSEHERGGS